MAKDYVPPYPQFPSEFLSDGDLYKIFMNHGLMMGRMISGSKSGYRDRYPENLVVFNANIVTKKRGKVWHGDLDVTIDEPKLSEVSKKLGENLYILYEMDARFENENMPFKFYESKCAAVITPSEIIINKK